MSDSKWPVELAGVTESVVTTLGPNGLWNVAALGVFASDSGDQVTARTWGKTRTRRNFETEGDGHVQFVHDPIIFVDAACSIREEPEPILESADAWATVAVEPIGSGEERGTEWIEWELVPIESTIERETVPTTNRGYYAVIEATVAASRLDVPGYDREELRERLQYFEAVVDRCGGSRERRAFDRLCEHVSF